MSTKRIEALTEPGYYLDFNEDEPSRLYLQVTRTARKDGSHGIGRSWVFRYTLAGKAREMGLGPFRTVPLAQARRKAQDASKLLADGVDPIEHRRAAQAAQVATAAARRTFRACAEQYIADNEAGWRNAKHAAQWRNTLATYAYPIIGELPIGDVRLDHVLQIVQPLWQTKNETASRLRGRIESVIDWATVREYRTGDNPARWRGHLSKLLPARARVRKVKSHGAVPWETVPTLVGELRTHSGVAARALEFVILTAARVSEAVRATWAEVDLEAGVWEVPAERMKSGRVHRVPLSPRALAILKDMPALAGSGGYLFPSPVKDGKHISDAALLETVRELAGKGMTTHGFRSAFRDWTAERTNYSREVAEMALAHAIRDETEAAYRRGDLFEKRRRLMGDWAKFLDAPSEKSNKVVPMRGRKSA